MSMQIVIAWIETVHVHDGQPWSADLGTRPGMREEQRPLAAMWMREGTSEDAGKAVDFAEALAKSEPDSPPRYVFVYGSDEADPLGRAKLDAVRCEASR